MEEEGYQEDGKEKEGRDILYVLDFKLSPCFICSAFSFWYLPGVWVLKAGVSEHSIGSIFIDLPMKMEPIECSETSGF